MCTNRDKAVAEVVVAAAGAVAEHPSTPNFVVLSSVILIQCGVRASGVAGAAAAAAAAEAAAAHGSKSALRLLGSSFVGRDKGSHDRWATPG